MLGFTGPRRIPGISEKPFPEWGRSLPGPGRREVFFPAGLPATSMHLLRTPPGAGLLGWVRAARVVGAPAGRVGELRLPPRPAAWRGVRPLGCGEDGWSPEMGV